MQTTELTTDQKGAIAETAIIHAAVKLGIGVLKPLTEGERYDLICDLRPQLLRVQCKWAPLHGDVIVVRSYSNRRTPTVCSDAVMRQVDLRVAPSLNNQSRGINSAAEFGFERLQSLLPGP